MGCKKLLICVFCLLSGGMEHPLFASFRGWEFGVGFQQITREETAEFVRTTPTAAVFNDHIFGFETKVIYHFSPDNDALIAGAYDIDCTGFEIEEILDHFMKVKTIMDERYGKSLKTGVFWWTENSQYRNDLVNAFRFAEVSFRSEWFGPDVIVTVSLSNELNKQGKIVYTIDYQPGRKYDLEADRKKL